jgi:hypothetical protein
LGVWRGVLAAVSHDACRTSRGPCHCLTQI